MRERERMNISLKDTLSNAQIEYYQPAERDIFN